MIGNIKVTDEFNLMPIFQPQSKPGSKKHPKELATWPVCCAPLILVLTCLCIFPTNPEKKPTIRRVVWLSHHSYYRLFCLLLFLSSKLLCRLVPVLLT